MFTGGNDLNLDPWPHGSGQKPLEARSGFFRSTSLSVGFQVFGPFFFGFSICPRFEPRATCPID